MKSDILNHISNLLAPINESTVDAYKNAMGVAVEYVNEQLLSRNDASVLVGANPFELVKQNHQNHADFMLNIFLTKDVKKMHETYIWAYNIYHHKGFLFRYFYYELLAWKEAFEQLNNEKLTPIVALYEYLILQHDYFVQHAATTKYELPPNIDESIYQAFMQALLKTDVTKAIAISNEFIQHDEDIKSFWEHIILPALYNIGNLWANAEISVGQEHTATSICQRVMAEHYAKILPHIENKSTVLVTTSPNELHEVGSRMIADILELNGYNVIYLSSKTPSSEILMQIDSDDIKYVIISTTLVSNLEQTKELISEIKDAYPLDRPTIIVGGQAFSASTTDEHFVGADFCLSNTNQLLDILNKGKVV